MEYKPRICVVAASGPLFIRNVLETGALDVLSRNCDVIGIDTGEVPSIIEDKYNLHFVAKIPISSQRAKIRHFCRYLSMWQYRDRSSTFAWKFVADISRRRRWVSQILVSVGIAKLFIRVIEKILKPQSKLESTLDAFKPDFVIIFTSCSDILTTDVIKACQKRGILTMSIVNGWDNPSAHGVWPILPDRVGVWGEQMCEHVVNIQKMNPAAVTILGVPQFSYYYNQSPVADILKLRQALDLPLQAKVVLFAGASRQLDEIPLLIQLEHAIIKGQLDVCKIIYRPHPWRKPRGEPNFFAQNWRYVVLDPQMEDALRTHLSGRVVKPHNFLPDLPHSRYLLTLVDAVICPLSTFMVESAVMGKPVLAIATQEGGHISAANLAQCEHFKELAAQAGFRFCIDTANLIVDLNEVLAMPMAEKSIINAKIRRIVYQDVHSYSQRLWEAAKPLLLSNTERGLML